MSEFLLTQEVGSLAKPDWRVLPLQGKPITEELITSALAEASEYDVSLDETEDMLRTAQAAQKTYGQLNEDHKHLIKDVAAKVSVRLQEKAGIDIVYDGEQDRSEMYQHAIERTSGFDWRGRVRAFDNRSYRKAACIDEPHTREPWHASEVSRLQNVTNRQIKVPITGAYTLAAWSYDEFYKNRRDLTLALARNVIRPNIASLIDQGIEWVQIDEPAATTVPGEVPLFIESFNESVAGLVGKFSVHICFSDYSLLFPYVQNIENCSQFSLEFANRDSSTLGTDAADRPAYNILQDFARHTPDAGIGLGVTTVHENSIEDPELVRDRILYAVEAIGGDASKIYPSPDCGLRTRSRKVAFDKLRTTVLGTQLAREQI